MDSIIALCENFDITAFLPELDTLLGQLELVLHSQIDAYYEDSLYGEPVAYFEKVN